MSSLPPGGGVSIIGDKNVASATILPDLARAATGETLRVSANTDDLNNFQHLELSKLFIDTKNNFYPAVLQGGSNFFIAFTTPGFTDPSKWVLELPIQLNATLNAIAGDASVYTGVDSNRCVNAYEAEIPNTAFLQCFNKAEVALGEESTVLGRIQSTFPTGLRFYPQTLKLSRDEIKVFAQTVGSPTHLQAYYESVFPGYNNDKTPFKGSTIKSSNKKTDDLLLQELSKVNDSLFSKAYWDQSVAKKANSSIVMSLPIKYICSAFEQSYYLPPGVKVRLTFEMNPNPYVIFDRAPYHDELLDNKFFINNQYTRLLGQFIASGVNNTTSPALHMRSHTLDPIQQTNFNQNWARKELLINYNTFEIKEVPIAVDGNDYFEFDLAVSQQRPTEIFVKLLPPSSMSGYVNPRTVGGDVTVDPVRLINDIENTDCSGIQFGEIEVDFAGHTEYRLRLESKDQWTACMIENANTIVNRLVNSQTYQILDRSSIHPFGRNGFYESPMLRLSVDPGDSQQLGYRSVDMGAVSIRMRIYVRQMSTSLPFIPRGYRIIVFKTLPEQFTLNAERRATIIKWPAIKTNNGYLVQPTINTNF